MDEVDLVNDLQERALDRFLNRKKVQAVRTSDWCNDCGGEIEPERLKALPHAVLCISCQKLFEIKRGR